MIAYTKLPAAQPGNCQNCGNSALDRVLRALLKGRSANGAEKSFSKVHASLGVCSAFERPFSDAMERSKSDGALLRAAGEKKPLLSVQGDSSMNSINSSSIK